MFYTDDEIRAHAKLAARFQQALMLEGVGPGDANSMAGDYLRNAMIVQRFPPPPDAGAPAAASKDAPS